MTALGRPRTGAVFSLLLLGVITADAQPRVINGELRTVPATSAASLQAWRALAPGDTAVWVGYAVPRTDGSGRMCCWSSSTADGDGCCQACRLEPQRGDNVVTDAGAPSVQRLEQGMLLHVLVRVQSGTLEQVRTFSDDCTLDAGGRTVHWLTGITPASSIALLSDMLDDAAPRRVVDGALAALAMHRDAAALQPLTRTAREGGTTHLRGQALFWLAQRAGQAAIGVISEAIANDPETDVKKRAVFALSQLPKDEGVPLLIDVARNNRNPAVRKQAMFWLGQSKDARALKFFEEILFRPKQ